MPVGNSSFQIGVDGGATKTECILVDAAGTIVARYLAPGCNANITGNKFWGAPQLKVGSFTRSERMAKWNEGLRLAEAIGGRLPPASSFAWGR